MLFTSGLSENSCRFRLDYVCKCCLVLILGSYMLESDGSVLVNFVPVCRINVGSDWIMMFIAS